MYLSTAKNSSIPASGMELFFCLNGDRLWGESLARLVNDGTTGSTDPVCQIAGDVAFHLNQIASESWRLKVAYRRTGQEMILLFAQNANSKSEALNLKTKNGASPRGVLRRVISTS